MGKDKNKYHRLNRRTFLKDLNRVVVKIGTSVLTSETNQLDLLQLKNLVSQISSFLRKGLEVILVTSGAIASGMGLLGLRSRPRRLPELQAAAAAGQSQLMRTYHDFFRTKGFTTAQILLTQEDLIDRKRYLNAKNTILTLLDYKVVPIINENDTVSVDEIKFGDNDRLSALVSNLIDAQLLIILSDIDGLYKNRRPILMVKEITPQIESLASRTAKDTSIGGMVTKIEAAKIVTNSGVPLIVANGRKGGTLLKIIKGESVGTLFLPKADRMVSRKRWIAFSSKPQGKIVVDYGARHALVEEGRSLLSAGVVTLQGRFEYGDIISIMDEKEEEFARGLCNYSSKELEKIKGAKSEQIKEILGYKYYEEVVHRDNLVIL